MLVILDRKVVFNLLCTATLNQPTITQRSPSKTQLKHVCYSCIHKISTRDPSKNGSPPLWGRDPSLKTTALERWLVTSFELKISSVSCFPITILHIDFGELLKLLECCLCT